MRILDENKLFKTTSGRKKGVVFNGFFGRGRIFEVLTKKTGQTGSLDENVNMMFNTRGSKSVRRGAQTSWPFASTCPQPGAVTHRSGGRRIIGVGGFQSMGRCSEKNGPPVEMSLHIL